ncbi:hypothetical protein GXB84_16800 [Stenotrophomonas acidaminiphila]|uniref:PP_RS20740 family protein n=1 Tax=Stenotrophomonas acidaminiphila TaxID=128780 RepID=UPI00137645D5|nr:hypothetical protein [Stenotrophomonas acidaminiphila]NCT88976.1 hypothetical protein [Stenotrophomonas acidaminiphila]
MNNIDPDGQGIDELDESALGYIYGDRGEAPDLSASRKRADFKAWHHPVKQFVREKQWLTQVERLLGQSADRVVVYLSLPGEDMFDVRVIGDAVKRRGGKLRLLGFNSRRPEAEIVGAQMNAESILRQEGIITDDSLTLPDRLQDIVVGRSHAYRQMASYGRFDIVNIDLCDHLGAAVNGHSIFDVIERIVAHQRASTVPWLFMLTTRVHPDFIGLAKENFTPPLRKNIELGAEFAEQLAGVIGVESCVAEDVERYWGLGGDSLLKIFAVGLGKYLLHLLHNQIQDPAVVELASCCEYRVEAQHMDMLSVVFRISPKPKVIIPVDQVGAVEIPSIEINNAIQIARKVSGAVDVDAVLQDRAILRELVERTEALLAVGNYDVSKYRDWLESHSVRPCVV